LKRDLYTDNNLRQKLIGASVAVPANAAKPALIQVCVQLNKYFVLI
jgi:hypothetical protein